MKRVEILDKYLELLMLDQMEVPEFQEIMKAEKEQECAEWLLEKIKQDVLDRLVEMSKKILEHGQAS